MQTVRTCIHAFKDLTTIHTYLNTILAQGAFPKPDLWISKQYAQKYRRGNPFQHLGKVYIDEIWKLFTFYAYSYLCATVNTARGFFGNLAITLWTWHIIPFKKGMFVSLLSTHNRHIFPWLTEFLRIMLQHSLPFSTLFPGSITLWETPQGDIFFRKIEGCSSPASLRTEIAQYFYWKE